MQIEIYPPVDDARAVVELVGQRVARHVELLEAREVFHEFECGLEIGQPVVLEREHLDVLEVLERAFERVDAVVVEVECLKLHVRVEPLDLREQVVVKPECFHALEALKRAHLQQPDKNSENLLP